MKRILFVFCVLASFVASAQRPPNYLPRNVREATIGGWTDSTLTVPSGTTPSLRGGPGKAGSLFADTTGGNKGLHILIDGVYRRLVDTTMIAFLSSADTSNLIFQNIGDGITGTFARNDTLLSKRLKATTFIRPETNATDSSLEYYLDFSSIPDGNLVYSYGGTAGNSNSLRWDNFLNGLYINTATSGVRANITGSTPLGMQIINNSESSSASLQGSFIQLTHDDTLNIVNDDVIGGVLFASRNVDGTDVSGTKTGVSLTATATGTWTGSAIPSKFEIGIGRSNAASVTTRFTIEEDGKTSIGGAQTPVGYLTLPEEIAGIPAIWVDSIFRSSSASALMLTWDTLDKDFKVRDIPSGSGTAATAAELNTGTDNAKFASALALEGSKYLTQAGGKISATASGTNTYTATISPAITSYTSGQRFYITFTNANTGASTINLNSLGAKTINKNSSTALASGDIIAGQVVLLAYDGTNFQIIGSIGTGGISGLTVGTTTITSGTNTRILYNNSGVVGEYTVTGTGTTAVLSAGPTFTGTITGAIIALSGTTATPLTITNTAASSASTGAGFQFTEDDGAALGDGHRLGFLTLAGSRSSGGTISAGYLMEALADGAWSSSSIPTKIQWGLGIVGGTTRTIRFTQFANGQTAIGGAHTPSSYLTLPIGSAGAGLSPFKIPAGTNNTTPEAGAIERTTDKITLVIETGTARKEFTLNNIPLTSGRVPYVNPNGRLTDAAGMTFDGTGKLSLLDLTLVGLDVDAAPDTLLSIEGGIVAKYVIPTVSASALADSLSANTYTPTVVNNPAGYNSNVASSTHTKAEFQQVGTIVEVWGEIDVTATAGSTNSAVAITLPIASDLAALTDVTGTQCNWNVTTGVNYQTFMGDVQGDATNNRVIITFFSHAATALHHVKYSFSYQIK